jgi:hypothetical protein
VTKRPKGAERREALEAIQREQKAAQRKKNLLTALIGGVAGLVIIGGTVVAIANQERNDPTKQDLTAFGVAAASASCTEVETNPVTGTGNHVGPGTDQASITRVTYDTVPPTSGQHFANWLPSQRNFYSAEDRPVMERLVHNLEHGYNVVWYTDALPEADVAALEDLSAKIADGLPGNKFIASAWDPAYGAFPEGKTIGMSHWGAKEGFRQFCGKLSGPAIQDFVDAHPASDSPEPNAA